MLAERIADLASDVHEIVEKGEAKALAEFIQLKAMLEEALRLAREAQRVEAAAVADAPALEHDIGAVVDDAQDLAGDVGQATHETEEA